MCDLLSFEADRRAVNITINRYSAELHFQLCIFQFTCTDALLQSWFLCFFVSVLGLSWQEMTAGSCTPTLVYCRFSLKAIQAALFSVCACFSWECDILMPLGIHMVTRNWLSVKMLTRFISNHALNSMQSFFYCLKHILL